MFALFFGTVSAADRFTVGGTTWGDWGEWSRCDDGHFFNGYRLKIESNRGSDRDDTALNAIQFVCDNETPPTNSWSDPYRWSLYGKWGEWGDWLYCPEGSYVNGVRFFSEPDVDGDDTAANNMHIHCYGGTGVDKYVKNIINADNHVDRLYGWGTLMEDKDCPQGMAISGFRTRVEDTFSNTDKDDTALNQMQAECTVAPNCVKIKLVDIKVDEDEIDLDKVDPQEIFLGEDEGQCISSTESTWSYTASQSKTEAVSESYSYSKSLSETFKFGMAQSVAFEVSAGIKIEGVFDLGSKTTTTFSFNQEYSTETSTTETSTEMKETATTLAVSTTYTKTLPGHVWHKFDVTYKKYNGEVPYTATAVCYDPDDKEITREPVNGIWKRTGVTESVLTTTDKTDMCLNRHVCECAGKFSTVAGGQVCATSPFLLARGEWCYVFRGACDEGCTTGCTDDGETGELSQLWDAPVSSSMFQWSTKPCQGSGRRLDQDGINERLSFA